MFDSTFLILALVIFLIFAFLATLGFFFWYLRQKFRDMEESRKGDQSLLMLNQSLQGLRKSVDERLGLAAQAMGELNKELGGLKEIGRHMQSLQDFLRSPKLRGNIGEQVLQNLLEQYFPKDNFQMQYKFKTGDRVDAILKTKQGIIPIDSKFPMENFQKLIQSKEKKQTGQFKKEFIRDVKKHIDSINKKYILPEEGTMDFAIMYIPSENIYYEVIRTEDNLDDYAREKRIYFVSPNSFYYFLKVVMMGLRGQEIQDNAKQIFKILSAVQKDAYHLEEALGLITTHVNNAKKAVDKANQDHAKLLGRVDQIKLLK